jgi:hypothetical protein
MERAGAPHPIEFDTFSSIFRQNLRNRSRTAKGISDTSSSPHKISLPLSGDALRVLVEANSEALIYQVWADAASPSTAPQDIRQMAERWFDVINQGLVQPEKYRELLADLTLRAERRAAETGKPYHISPRYRLWSAPHYDVDPIDIDLALTDLYNGLARRLESSFQANQPELLAFADLMIDGKIHPWSDGCGRHATAMVMWLSIVLDTGRLPKFATRDHHYHAIRTGDLAAHTRYYERCLGL